MSDNYTYHQVISNTNAWVLLFPFATLVNQTTEFIDGNINLRNSHMNKSLRSVNMPEIQGFALYGNETGSLVN